MTEPSINIGVASYYNDPANSTNPDFSNPYSILVYTQNHILKLYKNGIFVKQYPVAVGKTLTPTPKGDFRIINKALHPGGAFGVRWLGLNAPGGGYGIHGTNNPDSIGKSISHGCIRMYNNDVIELNNMVPIGTPVKIV